MFKGSGVALVTPFHQNGIDFKGLKQLIEWHIEAGTDALIIMGSTGEGATLSHEEKLELLAKALAYAQGKLFMVANTGSNDTAASILLSQQAKAMGYDALLAVAPYYNKPTQRGLIAHFTAIADAVQHPIILYNVPGRTAVNISAETTLLLAQHPFIQGTKEASHDLIQIEQIIQNKPKDFAVFSGNDDQNEAILRLGGQGVISVVGNVVPHRIKAQCVAGLTQDSNTLTTISAGLEALSEVLFIESNPVPVKSALNRMGKPAGVVRLPLVDLEAKHQDILFEVLRKEGLL
jgi:4-hydroxy-tetrahydrodipicolinate synthase